MDPTPQTPGEWIATLLGTGYMAQRPGQPATSKELESAEMLPSETATNYGHEGRYTER